MDTPSRYVRIRTPEFLKWSIHFLYFGLIAPRSVHEDDRRREFILNVILAGSIVLSGVSLAIVWYDWLTLWPDFQGVPPLPFTGVFLLFAALLALSRRGFSRLAAAGLVSFYFIVISYIAYLWGVDLPTALLSYALLVVIASILASTRAGFIAAALSSLHLMTFGYLEERGLHVPKGGWKQEALSADDTIAFAVLLLVIALVSWLSNREIERSLRRARRSEAELKRERDLLETKVAERTKALKQVELEKMSQLYRFAELGRHAAGIFHELMNPLTAVALNVTELEKHVKGADGVKQNLELALSSARRMEKIIQALRKQMGERDVSVSYSLNEEIHQVMQLFEYKAKSTNVMLEFIRQHDIATYGNPLKFHQIVANLVSNALDAYEGPGADQSSRRKVEITLAEHRDIVRLTVQDWGPGIPAEHLPKIFDPFFTTKGLERGTGIGLATVRHLVEQSLGGTVSVESAVGSGTKFTVEFAA